MSQRRDYVMTRIFKASNGIAQGIFVTLGIGLLVENVGKLAGWSALMKIGFVAKMLMSPAIGAGIAFMLGSTGLVVFSAMIAAAVGAGAIQITPVGVTIVTGEPIGALLAATAAVYIGKRLTGRTPVDMMLVPLASIVLAGLLGLWLSAVITPILNTVGGFIKTAAEINLFICSIVLAVVWGLLLLSPASSAALAIALNLEGVAGGAALAGCAAPFIAFALISAKENDIGGILAQAICTPKVQLPNITKNLKIIIPSVVASAVMGPVSALLFHIEAPSQIAGMGLSSFIAPIMLVQIYNPAYIIPAMLITYILLPAVISYPIYLLLRKSGHIRPGDLALPKE
ncbi:PTS sugar transporter subunit IIC [Paenibacillus agilis]|uniref:PTS sugar transporter subunit IIC n=1 Tax=Paenibacillus agilis TaxID=3020863 RepID=A0A559IKT0_9BACL|nr:PTS sugar transporter subunit IIC [Paenibacillus agilis]TVX88268.1 PTS sugar transporter subunit IIC [Paenibacillus agilis]